MSKRPKTPLQWSGVNRLPGLEGRIPPSRRGAIVLSTVGSLGDLYPILSIARALEEVGAEVRLALGPDDCEVARQWGLLAHPVGPSEAEVSAATGLTRDQIAQQVLHDVGPLIRDVAIPALPRILEEIAPLMDGAALACGTVLALGAPLAAERADVPYVPIALQPMLTLSPHDMPNARGFELAVPSAKGGLPGAWNAALLALGHRVFRFRHRRALDQVRASVGLPPGKDTPVLETPGTILGHIGLWSPAFAPLPPDRQDWLLTGFPPAPLGELPLEVQTWLDDGPAPLVVTLGSAAQSIAGPTFWDDAAALARRLGLRAVLLHGKAPAPTGDDILAVPYVAHAPLFPRAAAIIHHGGIGTTAEALRAGKPQLVVPIGGDQMDNATRLERMGVAATLPAKRFTLDRASARLGPLLDQFDYAKAGRLADQIKAEDGAAAAARHLIRLAGI